MCLYPKLILNKKYIGNKSNGGNPPPLPKMWKDGVLVDDLRVKYVSAGCGKCMECMSKKKNEWRIRLAEELEHNDKKAIFVTLTFSNESIKDLRNRYFKDNELDYEFDNNLARKAVRLFLERWRKDNKRSVKHWLITELGHEGTENVHLHGIIWTDKGGDYINKKWNYGFTWCSDLQDGYVNGKTINYITKYCTKIDEKHQGFKPKILASPGIGRGFKDKKDFRMHKYRRGKTREYYMNEQGHKMSLPIYYRNMLYNEHEKEALWKEKLDEKVRFVLGREIDVSTDRGIQEYYNLLEVARQKNKRLGFGDDEVDWDKWEYERRRRKINYEKRLQ